MGVGVRVECIGNWKALVPSLFRDASSLGESILLTVGLWHCASTLFLKE